MTPAKIASFFD